MNVWGFWKRGCLLLVHLFLLGPELNSVSLPLFSTCLIVSVDFLPFPFTHLFLKEMFSFLPTSSFYFLLHTTNTRWPKVCFVQRPWRWISSCLKMREVLSFSIVVLKGKEENEESRREEMETIRSGKRRREKSHDEDEERGREVFPGKMIFSTMRQNCQRERRRNVRARWMMEKVDDDRLILSHTHNWLAHSSCPCASDGQKYREKRRWLDFAVIVPLNFSSAFSFSWT